MGENDYESGYRGNQFHHGMDRAAYEAGKAKKEEIEAIGRMAGGGQPVEVPGVAFTLLLVAPLIWMVYPLLGVTIMIVPAVIIAIFSAFKQLGWGLFLAFILGVASFIPGMKLEGKVSQLTVYRWFRGIMRIVLPFLGIAGAAASKNGNIDLNSIPPGAIVGGFFASVITYLVFQRLDLIYFPAAKEIKKMQTMLAKGERPQRPMIKRVFFGFCWLIPTVVILAVLEMVVIRLFMNATEGRELFNQIRPILACVNFVIWLALFMIGKLPGTGKYMFNKRHEEDIRNLET